MPVISIIIPAYNAGKCIGRCVRSIIDYSSEHDIEIIIIDDGSKDDTLAISRNLENLYSEVHVLHIDNSGPSAARNKGLDMARGEYICFVDADDTVSEDYLDAVITEGKGCDITFFGYKEIDIDTGENRLMQPEYSDTLNERTEIENRLADLQIHRLINFFGFTWSKVFKGSIIRSHNIRFRNDIIIKEDEIFTLDYCRYVESLKVLSRPLYNYYISSSSVSHSGKTAINYDVLSHEFFELGRQYVTLRFRKLQYSHAVIYGLGLINSHLNGRIDKLKILREINDRIIPALVFGFSKSRPMWMKVVTVLPRRIQAVTIYYLLKLRK